MGLQWYGLQVFTDGMGVGVTADVAMWNALLNVAGYSGKIDQALGVMEKMQVLAVRRRTALTSARASLVLSQIEIHA